MLGFLIQQDTPITYGGCARRSGPAVITHILSKFEFDINIRMFQI